MGCGSGGRFELGRHEGLLICLPFHLGRFMAWSNHPKGAKGHHKVAELVAGDNRDLPLEAAGSHPVGGDVRSGLHVNHIKCFSHT